jgi:hypothetical protein
MHCRFSKYVQCFSHKQVGILQTALNALPQGAVRNGTAQETILLPLLGLEKVTVLFQRIAKILQLPR